MQCILATRKVKWPYRINNEMKPSLYSQVIMPPRHYTALICNINPPNHVGHLAIPFMQQLSILCKSRSVHQDIKHLRLCTNDYRSHNCNTNMNRSSRHYTISSKKQLSTLHTTEFVDQSIIQLLYARANHTTPNKKFPPRN